MNALELIRFVRDQSDWKPSVFEAFVDDGLIEVKVKDESTPHHRKIYRMFLTPKALALLASSGESMWFGDLLTLTFGNDELQALTAWTWQINDPWNKEPPAFAT